MIVPLCYNMQMTFNDFQKLKWLPGVFNENEIEIKAMKFNSDTIIVLVFYLILIGIIGIQLKKVINSQTAFEEYEIPNGTKLPSFTLCPYSSSNSIGYHSIETFEEAMIAIENAKKDYSVTMHGSRRFEKG